MASVSTSSFGWSTCTATAFNLATHQPAGCGSISKETFVVRPRQYQRAECPHADCQHADVPTRPTTTVAEQCDFLHKDTASRHRRRDHGRPLSLRTRAHSADVSRRSFVAPWP